MKKVLFLLLALMLMLGAAACQASQPVSSQVTETVQPVEPSSGETEMPAKPTQSSEDIQITVKEQTVAGDAESISLTIMNASDKEYTYGAMSTIEAEKNGAWEEVKPLEDMFWIEIAYIIAPGQSNEETVTLKANYGTLVPGNYRVVKTFTSEDGSNLTAYGQFTVQ